MIALDSMTEPATGDAWRRSVAATDNVKDRNGAEGAGSGEEEGETAGDDQGPVREPVRHRRSCRRRAWRSMYRSICSSAEEMRERDEQKLWFFDQMHNPEPLYPFDLMMPESWLVSLNQYTTRIWQLPTALGIEHRIVNGYLYLSPNVVDDPEEIAAKEPVFLERAGTTSRTGRDLRQMGREGDRLHRGLKRCVSSRSPSGSRRPPCSRRGHLERLRTSRSVLRLLENMHEMAYYHFEMLNLAYGAYLTFLEFCRGTSRPSPMTSLPGWWRHRVILYRPDAELRRLAHRAVELRVATSHELDHRRPD